MTVKIVQLRTTLKDENQMETVLVTRKKVLNSNTSIRLSDKISVPSADRALQEHGKIKQSDMDLNICPLIGINNATISQNFKRRKKYIITEIFKLRKTFFSMYGRI